MVDLARTASSSTLAGESAAVASPAHNVRPSPPSAPPQTNDALEPARSASLSLSPSAALQKLAPETYASHTPLDVAIAPTNEPPSAPSRRISISADEARLIQGSYRKPADATPIPHPLFHPWTTTAMKNKPGATHTLKLRDTLLDSGPPAPPVRKVYGHTGSSYRQSLFREESSGPATIWQSTEGSPAKKRKTVKDDSRQTINISEDEEDVKPSLKISPRAISRNSAESGQQHIKSPTSLRRSEFEIVARITEPPRSKRSRKANGPTKASYIVLDEEEPTRKEGSPDDLLCSPPGTGISNRTESTHGQDVVVKSHHFAYPISRPKMNHSTYPPRGTLDHTPRKTENGSSKTSDALNVPSEDELFTISDVKQSTKGCWPLLFARAPGYHEETPKMYLQKTGPNEYLIKSPTSNFNSTLKRKHDFTFKKINQMWIDKVSRIRLLGPMDMNLKHSQYRYMVDLQFAKQEHLKTFAKEVESSITARQCMEKTEEDMDKVFQKALHSIAKSSASTHETQPQIESQPALKNTHQSNLLSNLREPHDKRANPETAGRAEPNGKPAQNRSVTNRPVRTTRATNPINVAAEEEPEQERYSVVHGLGPAWRKPLQYGSGRRSTMVDFSDLERLDNGQFLNDQIIEFYLLYLFNEMNVPEDKVYIYNTHFFTSLTRRVPGQKSNINYQGVAKWTSKVDIFGYDYIIVPINQESHWYLAIICNVSNISRVPAIDDQNKTRIPGAGSSDCPKSDSIIREEGAVEAAPQSTPTSAPNGDSFRISHPHMEEIDDGLDLIDIHATKSLLPVEHSSSAQSSTVATARLQNTLTEPKPRGILLDSGSPVVSPKKKKRKNAAPLRKWDVDKPVIIVLDSLGNSARSNTVRALKDYIREEGQHKRGMEAEIKQNAYYAKDNQIPMQDNYYDCGVYLLGYAQKFFEDPDRFKQRLLTGEMQLETDWPDMAMPKMRDKMREILLDLGKAQDEELRKAKSAKKRNLDGIAKPVLESKPVPEEPVKDNKERPSQHGDSTPSDTSDSSIAKHPDLERPFASANLGLSNLGPSRLGPRAGPPRLGSPFEPKSLVQSQAFQIPASEMSAKVIRPGQVPELELERLMNGKTQKSLSTRALRRNKSPVVMPNKSPVTGKSSKRPLPLDKASTDISTSDTVEPVIDNSPKKPRLEGKARHNFGALEVHELSANNDRLPILEAQSPTARHRSKASRMGSSHEPIEIDSQEMEVTSPKKPLKEVHDLDIDLDLVVMSPTSRPSTKTIQGQQRQPLSHQQQVRQQITARPNGRQSPIVQIKPRSTQSSPSIARDRDPQQPRPLHGTRIIQDSVASPALPRSRRKRMDPNVVILDDEVIPESPPAKRSSPPAPQDELQFEDSLVDELQ